MSLTVTPAQIRDGARHTGLLLTLRWRMLRSLSARVLVIIGLALLVAVLFGASSVGAMLTKIAEQGADTAINEFAVNYVIALKAGEFGSVGALALGSAVAASIFSPFTGAANLSLLPGEDLSGLRPPRVHRYFDSLVTVGASTIGFMQLLSLTVVGSLLTLDGGRTGGLLFTWAVWPPLILLSVAEGWALEWLHRRMGKTARRGVLAGLAAIVGLALLIDPQHGRTLFGVGTLYARVLVDAGHGNTAVTVAAFAVLLTLSVVLLWAGAALCAKALSLPAVPTGSATTRKRLIPVSGNPKVALAQVLWSQLVRSPEVRRPIMTILVLAVPAGWVAGNQRETMFTLVIAVPLSVALAWGVNVFGVIGPAMTWLASQPYVMRWLLALTTVVHVAAVIGIAVLCWGPLVLFGRVNGSDIAGLAAALTVATALTARSSAAKSVHRPYLARLGSRGDTIIPPLAAINYTLRLALFGGLAGIAVLGLNGNRQVQSVIVVIAVLWSLARYAQLTRTWLDRSKQARVIAAVADA